MRGSHHSKRISWAPAVNLCQVRLFLLEESPSQVGLDAQDHLQAKKSWQHSPFSDDALPPGFEGGNPESKPQMSVSEIHVIKWICPPRILLDFGWQVVAGEESKEVEIQNQREMRVLEAFYPGTSAIPPNSSVSADIESLPHNEKQIPLIPITPMEDEDAAMEPSSDFSAPFSVSMSSQAFLARGSPPLPQCSMSGLPNMITREKPAAGTVSNVEPDIVAAAAAAFTAIGKSSEPGNLIDQDLLIKILSNPKIIEKLVADKGPSSTTNQLPKQMSSFAPLPNPSVSVTLSNPSAAQIHRTETSGPSVTATSGGSIYPQSNEIGLRPFPNTRIGAVMISPSPVKFPPAKDVNYYKNLIQQHGGERPEAPQQNKSLIQQHGIRRQEPPHQYNTLIQQHGIERRERPQQYKNLTQQHGGDRQEFPQQFSGRYNQQLGGNQELTNNPRPRDIKPKINKPCIYFNSSRGCRHGVNCAYQHDASSQQQSNNMSEVQSTKRMKLDREISS